MLKTLRIFDNKIMRETCPVISMFSLQLTIKTTLALWLLIETILWNPGINNEAIFVSKARTQNTVEAFRNLVYKV